ncbi:MAG: Ig-like domain-containing protein [Bacteroidales bacterium]|nr:Ig-like domain-containing protein [Lachnoclostridium sp.]MCM1382982.1 Ig-like domain-containing protein [Lachnoclostridium sp.]MCM1463964.1 Ig-like domain-containing protein [Bacteroidales bacterium]
MKKTKFLRRLMVMVLAACLAVGMVPQFQGGVQAETAESLSEDGQCQQIYEGSNVNAQNYGNSSPYWSNPIESYLVPMADGGVMRVQAGDKIDGLLVEYYDADYNAQVSKNKLIPKELPIFGGFYAAEDAYYVLSGQSNLEEKSDVEVYRITKYDKNWNRLGCDGLKDCNTTKPFNAGSARMEAYGSYLLVRTSHEMYKSEDGINHQANVTIQLDMQDVKITDSHAIITNSYKGYVSHSFNQFLHIENGHLIAVDHGDAHPRSAVLIKYPTDVAGGKFSVTTGSCDVIDVMTFPGETGANDTGASVGAFEISSSSYLVAGNSGIKNDVIGETHNVFVAAVDKTTNKITTTWLTEFAEGEGTTSTPHMVKLSSDRFVVLWTKGQNVYYVAVDGNGAPVSSIYSMKGELSDCAPVVNGGNITWYTWRNEALTFYDINTSDFSSNEKTAVVAGHQYEIVKTENGISTLKCSVCGAEKTVGVYASYFVRWKESNAETYSDQSISGKKYDAGDIIYFWAMGTNTDAPSDVEINEEWMINVSDEDKVLCTITSENGDGMGLMGYFTMLAPGEVTLSFCPRYNPDNKKTFNLVINSDPITGIEVTPATLNLLEGATGQLKTAVKPDSADQSVTFSSSDTTVATVNEEGLVTAVKAGTATITATAADGTHTGACTVTVTAHEHVFDTATWYKDKTTHWHQCTQDNARSDEAAHSMKEIVDKAATEDEVGSKHGECTVCGYESEAVEIPKLDHTHAMTHHEEEAADCTKAGKKAYYECGKCHKYYSDEAGSLEITNLVIPALGHSFISYKFDEGSASCTKDGTETAKCDRCDVTDTRTVAGTKLPHQMSDWTTTAEPDCTTPGTKSRKCQNCDYTESEEIAALGHSWEDVLDRPATEEQTGLKHRECSVCHEKGEETEIPKLDHTHDMSALHEEKAATCTQDGTKAYYECSKCGKYYSDETGSLEIEDLVIPALGHSFTNYKFDEGSADCTKDGTKTAKCDRCDAMDTKTAEGTKLPHQMSEWTVVNPTCTEEGSRSRHCANCDYAESEKIDAIGHSWNEWVRDTEPTCTVEGSESRICSVCGEKETQAVKALGHKWSAVMTWAGIIPR